MATSSDIQTTPPQSAPPGDAPWRPGASVEGWTVPQILRARAADEPNRIALREKWLGVYQEYTWGDLGRQVAEVAAGLMKLGVQAGDRVAIMGDPCRQYVLGELGTWMAGAVSVGIYPTSSRDELRHQMLDSGATVFIAEDQEHLDKIVSVRAELPDLRDVVVIRTRALFLYDRGGLLTFDELMQAGTDLLEQSPDAVDRRVESIAPEDRLCLIYTSGTTGPPKGAMHSHRSLLYGTYSLVLPAPGLREGDERSVIHLPIAHVVGKILCLTLPLISRVVPHLPEQPDLVPDAIYEVAPTFVCEPPRFYEKYAAQLVVAMDASSRVKRAGYGLAMRVGRAVVERHYDQRRVPAHLRAAYALARFMVFTPLLRQIGYHELEHAQTGSAPVPPQVASLWHVWGVDLRIIYGLTESGGIITSHHRRFPRPYDIGERIEHPEWECRVAEDGELLFRGASMFLGYWGNEEATAEAVKDGWLQTGDVVETDDADRVKLIDRKKDLIITSGGKSLSPQQIENEIKASPYIAEAVALAEGRKYVTALLALDDTTVSEWCRAHRVPYTSYSDLVQQREVVEMIDREVAHANERLSRVEQVKKFRIMPVELDPEEGEVTPTRKIKRKLIEQMFEREISEMYSSDEQSALQSQVGTLSERPGARSDR